MKVKEPTVKYYVMMSSLLCLSIILQSIVVVSTPHTFVRIMNLISIIGASGIVGAFIREVFILKQKEEQVMKK
ncbi:hypothetical protein AB685_17725 [Bacillus sp. LL01]|uniref:hypothetical protein n=1 Tax=Bacillus sp. LL01 TaxID=1665556 RepID=UPI00064D4233|nr:hypothetical protein [Bacillus sp. LL01]KMJ57241.1 hypothetical protein AB685_17725 [Bacillus sp. LL01]